MKTVYISIGNSDDKLTQREWSLFWSHVDDLVYLHADRTHGQWLSLQPSEYQNACWCVEIDGLAEQELKAALRNVARQFGQDSISWAEATTEFLTPGGTVTKAGLVKDE